MRGEITDLVPHPRFSPAPGTDLPVGTGFHSCIRHRPTRRHRNRPSGHARQARRSNRSVAVALCAAMPSESEITCTALANSGVASRLMR